MRRSLPARPSLEWLKKTAKDELKRLRAQEPGRRPGRGAAGARTGIRVRQLAQAQATCRERERPLCQRGVPAPPLTRDQIVQGFLKLVGTGQIDEVRRILAAAPQMVNAVGPHPFWGGRPQPLHVAIETKRRDMFDLLLDAGADVNGSERPVRSLVAADADARP